MSLSFLERIHKELDSEHIEEKISRIIELPEPKLRDMVLFAEYCQRKHNRGFVVYWTDVNGGFFQVCNWDEWVRDQNNPWNGEVHWHTSKCPV